MGREVGFMPAHLKIWSIFPYFITVSAIKVVQVCVDFNVYENVSRLHQDNFSARKEDLISLTPSVTTQLGEFDAICSSHSARSLHQ